MACIVLVTYTIGWGALLAIGFVFNVAGHLDDMGSRVGKPAIIFSVLGIALGELAIALGLVKSMFPEPRGPRARGARVRGRVLRDLDARVHAAAEGDRRDRPAPQRGAAPRAGAARVRRDPRAERRRRGRRTRAPRSCGCSATTTSTASDPRSSPTTSSSGRSSSSRTLMAKPGDVAWIELPLRHVDGSIRWFEVGVTNRLDDPAVSGLVCNIRDVSDRRAAQEQLDVPGVPRRAHAACRTGGSSSSGSSRRCSTRRRTAVTSRCCSSTSTASSS